MNLQHQWCPVQLQNPPCTLSFQLPLQMASPFHEHQTVPIYVASPGIFHKGANNQTLVSLKDFQEKFAFPYMYGDTEKPWPNTTILLYKYSSHAITKYQVITENTWQRIDNDPRHGYYPGEHAESIMIKQLTEIQEHLKKPAYYRESYNGIHTIDVILNYSPCNEDPHYCSTKLCNFKNNPENDILDLGLNDEDEAIALMKKMSIKGKDEEAANVKNFTFANVKLKITFANFYQDYRKKNMEGLKELVSNGIELDILTGDKWLNFFDAVGLDRKTKLPKGREDREKADQEMFTDLMLQW